jgi:DNA end-binding protein Ku
MRLRAISRSTVSFGLVSIPVEVYPATSSKTVHFNLLHAKDDSRIQEKIFCVVENKEIPRSELVHGYQIHKGQYVAFSSEELKKLESGAGHEIEIVQFIPISEVDPVYFASSYLLGCGAGSDKAYFLLIAAMTRSDRAAIAKFVMRGKEHLVLIRPYQGLLMLHTTHYADEIRSPKAIDHAVKKSIGSSELKLAERLINDLSTSKFEPEQFEDTYRKKILLAVEQKEAGKNISLASAPRRGKVVDLMSALKDSLKVRNRAGSPNGSSVGDAHEDGADGIPRVRRTARTARTSRRAHARRGAHS